MRKKIFSRAIFILLSVLMVASCEVDNGTRVNRVDLSLQPSAKSFKIAVLADPHIDSAAALANLDRIITSVLETDPDFIVLLGDYSSTSKSDQFRSAVTQVLSRLDTSTTTAVLGNHEHTSGAHHWQSDFRKIGISLLRNESKILTGSKGSICVRGLDDYFSGKARPTPFPLECEHTHKITITHDPAAAYFSTEPGLYLAGHTHCGQINLPVLGSIWIPSVVPEEASCGLYESGDKRIFVSSGIGTSIVNFRLGTRSEWDLIEVDTDSLR